MAYQIYHLIDPRNNAVRYIGLSRDVQKRYKQHVSPSRARPWIQELLEQGLKPVLGIIESDIPNLEAAEARERYWITHHEVQGHALENLVKNEVSHRERAEEEALYQRLYTTYAYNLPPALAQQLIKMMLAGHKIAGISTWEDTYVTVIRTINILYKKPGFGLHLNEIDAAKITFNLFGREWQDGSEDEQ